MKIHPSLILAAALLFPGGNFLRAQTVRNPVDALAQKLQDDPKQRAEAGKHLEAFLLEPDSNQNSFVSADTDKAALGALARAWGSKADAKRLAALLVVSTPKTKAEDRLRVTLKKWTGAAQIKKRSEKIEAAAFLADAEEQAMKLLSDPRTAAAISEAIGANDQTSAQVPDSVRAATERAEKVSAKGAKLSFGADRTVQDSAAGSIPGATPAAAAGPGAASGSGPDGVGAGVGTGARGSETAAQRAADLNAAHRAGLDEPKRPAVAGEAPPPVVLQSLGSATWPPAPGVLDKASSLAASDTKTIAEDLKSIRGSLRDAVPAQVQGNTESNPDAVNQFFQWLRTAKESDMPTIDYTTLPKGEVGHYELGLVSKGDIKVNHFIRNEPAHARATVVVHELYHYWDKKVARNAYPNVSYGVIAAGTQHVHEYDAYLATSLYWEMVKKEGDASPLAKMLDGIPTDPGQVRELVNSKVGGR